jgi:hypothetical protein
VDLGGALRAPNLRVGRPDLTHRFSQPANMSGTATQRHCATCRGVCYFARRNRYLFFHRHFPRFPNTFLLYRWIHPSAVLVCFGVYPLHCHSVMLALREFSHIGTNPHVFHTSRVYFAANILFLFSSLLLPLV